MSYFAQMGTVWVNIDGQKLLLNDVTAFAQIAEAWKKDARVQIPYQVRDGELPHMISHRLYGTVEYWWTIMLMNNIFDFDNQWPRSQKQLYEYIERKYPGQDNTEVHHYINPQGLVADLLSLRIEYGLTDDAAVIDRAGLETISIEEYEIAANDVKRNIILVDPDYIQTVQTEYDKSMEV
jgi:hypothetical protein